MEDDNNRDPGVNSSTPESADNVEINPLPPPDSGLNNSNSTLASNPERDTLHQLSHDMFDKVVAYFHGELETVAEDYLVLEKMNRATMDKYVDMKQTGVNIAKALGEINEKYANIAPQLEQIDRIEESVTQLEQAAYKLDAYSKSLELRWKQFEKQSVAK